MQDAAAGDLDTALVGKLLDAHGHVVLTLGEQAFLELAGANDVAVTADQRRRGRLEDNGQGGRIDLDGIELDGILGIGVDVADVGGVDADHSGDIARANLAALGAAQVVKGEELLDGGHGALAAILYNQNLLALVNGTGVDATNADAADEVGVVDGDALHRQRTVHVDVGGGHVVNDHVKQREHIHVAVLGVEAGKAVHSARIDHVLHRKLKLLVGGTQVSHEVEAVVERALGLGAGTVDLVDDNHDRKTGVDGVAQNKAGLGHGALERINQKQGAVRHAQNALDLAAKVGMAGGIEDVDLHALILDGDVLSQNGDAAFALLIVGVEHALLHLLVRTESIRGAKELVNQGSLAVVDVGDDGDVP